jgi:D-amino-acid dehydrogenase
VIATTNARKADVAVIGGGVIGVSTALELARRGISVVLLERGGDLAWGCSAGNAGIVGAGHVLPLATPAAVREGLRWMTRPDSPFAVRPRPAVVPWLARFLAAATPSRVQHGTRVLQALATRSAALHDQLDADGLDAGYQRHGLLDVYRDERAFAAARSTHARKDEIVPAEELATIAPQLRGHFAGGILHRDEAHCDPLRFVLALGAWAEELGADIRTHVEVLGIRRAGTRVEALTTTDGDLQVGTVVLAAGTWSTELARSIGMQIPIEGGKGYHVDLESRPGDPELPIWLQESRVVITPLRSRVRLAGTLQLTGTDERIDHRRVAAITRAVDEALPVLSGRPPVHVWRGLRPCTPDGLPIIGAAPQLENLIFATGHGMWGLQLAPVTARLVASLVCAEPPEVDIAPLRPDRFSRPWRAARHRGAAAGTR